MALKDKQKSNRTIVLKFTQAAYTRFLREPVWARQVIDRTSKAHPTLFPGAMAQGYKLNGTTRRSKKLRLKMRKLRIGERYYQIRPSFVLPYMRGVVAEVEKPLFLLRFGVPFWALAVVFGRNAMYWYRLYVSLAAFSVVGTTVYRPHRLPMDVVADEHHIRGQGQKVYVATTVGAGCILGVEAVAQADAQTLQVGYAVFQDEARALAPAYTPKTVNTDGWAATQNAWRALFPKSFLIECFLHAFLKVRERALKCLQAVYTPAANHLWHCYRATTKRQMAQRVRRLAEWTTAHVPDSPMKEHLIKFCEKKQRWLAHLDFPHAHRTSSMLDRLMKLMERHAMHAQMFHSSLAQTTNNFRAFALLSNFTPSSPGIVARSPTLVSPAARLNGFVYHHHWLQNLLIAASLGGYRQHLKPL